MLLRILCVMVTFYSGGYVLLWLQLSPCSGEDMARVFGEDMDRVFGLLDNNSDGEISQIEAKNFISNNLNGDFQTEQEQEDAAELLLDNLDKHEGRDTGVTEEELEEHAQNLFQDFSIYEWMKFGLGLPTVAVTFRDKVKREDFPLLVVQDAILEHDLGIQSLLERQRIKRAVEKLLLGIGAAPGPPQDVFCVYNTSENTATLHWRPPDAKGTPSLHTYVIQRKSRTALGQIAEWQVTEDTTTFEVTQDEEPALYHLVAWNSYSRSPFVLVCCQSVVPQVKPTNWAVQVLLWLVVGVVTLAVGFRLTSDWRFFETTASTDSPRQGPLIIRQFKFTRVPTCAVLAKSDHKTVWLHIRSTLSLRPVPMRLYWLDVNSGNGGDLLLSEPNTNVVLMHADDTHIWLAHQGGYLGVWSLEDKVAICEPLRCFVSEIRSITSDSKGYAWVGSQRGSLRVVKLKQLKAEGQYGYVLDYMDNRDFNKDANDAHFDHGAYWAVTTSGKKYKDFPDGRVVGSYMYNNGTAHSGDVIALCQWTSRLWSAGLSSSRTGHTIREWHKAGQLKTNQRLQKLHVGPVVTMLVFSVGMPHSFPSISSQRAASVRSPAARFPSTVPSASSMGFSLSKDQREPCDISGSVSSSMSWQLLTGHQDGRLLVWDIGADGIIPMVTLAAMNSRIYSLSHIPSLHAVCVGLGNGQIALCELPTLVNLTSFRFGPRLGMNLALVKSTPKATVWAHFGAVLVVAGDDDILTMDSFGTIKLWHSEFLASLAVENGFESAEHDDVIASVPSMSRRIRISHTNVICREDLTLMQRMREGSFGVVYKGMWCGTMVAVKKLRQDLAKFDHQSAQGGLDVELQVQASELSQDSQASLESLQQEVNILSSLRHENVVLFLGVCLEPLCIVTSYYSMNSLYDLIAKLRRDPKSRLSLLSWRRRINMALDAARGMYYLHNRDPAVLHCDLKSPNLLVDKDLNVKVGDFGLSRLVSQRSSTNLRAFNPRWLPPEVLDGSSEMSKSTDVYSFGIILWELMTLLQPFPEMQLDQVFVAVSIRHERPKIPAASQLLGGTFDAIETYVQLMKSCWAEDPNQRPDFGSIMTTLQQLATHLKASMKTSRTTGSMESNLSAQIRSDLRAAASVPGGNLSAPIGQLASPFAKTDAPSGDAFQGPASLDFSLLARRAASQERRSMDEQTFHGRSLDSNIP